MLILIWRPVIFFHFFINRELATDLLVVEPLHAFYHGLAVDSAGEQRGHINSERLLGQHCVLARDAERVHVARLELPASVAGGQLGGLGEHTLCRARETGFRNAIGLA